MARSQRVRPCHRETVLLRIPGVFQVLTRPRLVLGIERVQVTNTADMITFNEMLVTVQFSICIQCGVGAVYERERLAKVGTQFVRWVTAY